MKSFQWEKARKEVLKAPFGYDLQNRHSHDVGLDPRENRRKAMRAWLFFLGTCSWFPQWLKSAFPCPCGAAYKFFHDVVNKYRRSRSLRRKVGDDVCRRITNLLPDERECGVKLCGKYRAQGTDRSFTAKRSRSFQPPSLFRPTTASSPCGSRPFLLPLSAPTPTPTPFALSLRLPLATRSHCSCNFHASKAMDTPRDDRSPSSTANFSSFCLNGTVPVLPQPVRRGWTYIYKSDEKASNRKHSRCNPNLSREYCL